MKIIILDKISRQNRDIPTLINQNIELKVNNNLDNVKILMESVKKKSGKFDNK